MRRALLAILSLLVALVLAGASAPGAEAGAGDNTAVAVNTKDGSSLFRFAFAIRKTAGEVVDQTNSAVAFASCESCRSIAIAIQIVLVSGSPNVVTPQNTAVAVNYECTLCETFAAAHQFVVGGGGRLRLTAEGRQELAQIRRQFQELRNADLALDELQLRVRRLVDRVRVVLASQLVPAGSEGEEEEELSEENEAETPSPERASRTGARSGSEESTTTLTTPTETTPASQAPAATAPGQTAPAQTAPATTTAPVTTETQTVTTEPSPPTGSTQAETEPAVTASP